MSTSLIQQYGLSTLSLAVGQNPGLTGQIFAQAVGYGSELGVLSFSRKHESEADKIGLIFMAMAGYDPQGAPKFWERMAAINDGQAQPEWLSTHPSDKTRISDLNAAMPEALKYYKEL